MSLTSVAKAKPSSAAAMLGFAWNREAFTASDAIAATGLTRSTVLGLCDGLREKGWLIELADARSDGTQYRKGRPARRYAFPARRAVVIGVDAGIHTITTQVADLRGEVLSHHSVSLVDPWPTADERLSAINRGIDDGLAAAGAAPGGALCVVVGVPAPTDAAGRSPEGRDRFWARMNPGLAEHLRARGWTAIIENDANLAAVAEGAVGSGRGLHSFITLLAGERIGCGFVVDGRLLRGGRGGAGESHPLDLIAGVGDADGIGYVVRKWAREVKQLGGIPPDSPLFAVPDDELGAEAVLRAADRGDPTAEEIVVRIAERLARIGAVLGGLLDVDRIILAGGVAESLTPLLDRTAPKLAELMELRPPELVASTLGSEVVTIGAVSRALAWCKDNISTLIDDPTPAAKSIGARQVGPRP